MRTRPHRSLGLPLALTLLAAAPVSAQELATVALSAPVDELSFTEALAVRPAQEAEDLARSVRRILHLRSGRTLVGVAHRCVALERRRIESVEAFDLRVGVGSAVWADADPRLVAEGGGRIERADVFGRRAEP